MTSYELTYLFNEHIDTLISILVAFFSVVSATLTAIVLAARTVPVAMVWVGVALYLSAVLPLVLAFSLASVILSDIRAQMGSDMLWHFAARQSPLVLHALCASVSLVMLAIVAGTVWFFFHHRNSAARERDVANQLE